MPQGPIQEALAGFKRGWPPQVDTRSCSWPRQRKADQHELHLSKGGWRQAWLRRASQLPAGGGLLLGIGTCLAATESMVQQVAGWSTAEACMWPPFVQAVDRRERLRRLAMETIDLAKDPYYMRNHLGQIECRLCLTLHPNEGNYLAHTQVKGKRACVTSEMRFPGHLHCFLVVQQRRQIAAMFSVYGWSAVYTTVSTTGFSCEQWHCVCRASGISRTSPSVQLGRLLKRQLHLRLRNEQQCARQVCSAQSFAGLLAHMCSV